MSDNPWRNQYQRLLKHLADELIASDEQTWADAVPLSRQVLDTLAKSWNIGAVATYNALLRRFAGFLETIGPFETLDNALQQSLAHATLTNVDFVYFADIRVRWLLQRGLLIEAKVLLTRAWGRAETPMLRIKVANREAVYWKEQGIYAKSFALFAFALAEATSLDNPRMCATVYNNLGNWAFAQEFYLQALLYYEEAWKIALPLVAHRILGGAAGGKEMALEALNRDGEAREALEAAQYHYGMAGFRPGLVRVLLNRAYLDIKAGKATTALLWCEEALRLARQLGDLQREASAYHNMALAYAKLKDWQSALEWFEKALIERRRLGQPVLIRTSSLELAGLGVLIRSDETLTPPARQQLLAKYDALLETLAKLE